LICLIKNRYVAIVMVAAHQITAQSAAGGHHT
jgi:hypothetical protein